jgi:hypothetical protein
MKNKKHLVKMSIETKPAPVPADDRTASEQTQLESLTGAAYRLKMVSSHVLFNSAPRRAMTLASRCWARLQSHFQDGSHARRIPSICMSGSGLGAQSTTPQHTRINNDPY